MELSGTKSNLLIPRNGEPFIDAISDFIIGAHLLTQKDQFFSRESAFQLISSLLSDRDLTAKIDFPPPAIWKPIPLWTGKQIFGLILRPNKACQILATLCAKAKTGYTFGEELCVNDSYVLIRNSELLAGTIDMVTLGSRSRNSIFYIIVRDYGEQCAADVMWRLFQITSYFLSTTGFSIGIGDMVPGAGLLQAKKKLLADGYTKCNDYIHSAKTGQLTTLPGCTIEETLETMIHKELSVISDRAADVCQKELPKSSRAVIMASCRSEWSFRKISQMMICIGQQSVNGQQVPNGFENRSLPYVKQHCKSPAAKGFVESSFSDDTHTATEFMFRAMAGRERFFKAAEKIAETEKMIDQESEIHEVDD